VGAASKTNNANRPATSFDTGRFGRSRIMQHREAEQTENNFTTQTPRILSPK
jgi:hypothetical protein